MLKRVMKFMGFYTPRMVRDYRLYYYPSGYFRWSFAEADAEASAKTYEVYSFNFEDFEVKLRNGKWVGLCQCPAIAAHPGSYPGAVGITNQGTQDVVVRVTTKYTVKTTVLLTRALD